MINSLFQYSSLNCQLVDLHYHFEQFVGEVPQRRSLFRPIFLAKCPIDLAFLDPSLWL